MEDSNQYVFNTVRAHDIVSTTSERQINRYKGDRCCRVRGHDYLGVGPARAREMRCARPFALNIYQGMPGLSRLAP